MLKWWDDDNAKTVHGKMKKKYYNLTINKF